jgi:hypothetical protein
MRYRKIDARRKNAGTEEALVTAAGAQERVARLIPE